MAEQSDAHSGRVHDVTETADVPESVGEQLADDAGEFSDVAQQFYRGEIDRVTTWRTRLDQTTNWAVIVMAAVLTWAFSSRNNPHYLLLIGMMTVTVFLVIEASRYRKYDVWRERVRTFQREFVAAVHDSRGGSHDHWRERIAADLRDPELKLSRWRALAHRLHNVYIYLLTVLVVAWVFRISAFEPNQPWRQTAAIMSVPGTVVAGVVAVFYLCVIALTCWQTIARRTSGSTVAAAMPTMPTMPTRSSPVRRDLV